MMDLGERIRRGREAIAKAEAEGKDVSEWVEHLRKLEVQMALSNIRPYLPTPLQRLREDQLIALVNLAILSAWNRAFEALEKSLAEGKGYHKKEAQP